MLSQPLHRSNLCAVSIGEHTFGIKPGDGRAKNTRKLGRVLPGRYAAQYSSPIALKPYPAIFMAP